MYALCGASAPRTRRRGDRNCKSSRRGGTARARSRSARMPTRADNRVKLPCKEGESNLLLCKAQALDYLTKKEGAGSRPHTPARPSSRLSGQEEGKLRGAQSKAIERRPRGDDQRSNTTTRDHEKITRGSRETNNGNPKRGKPTSRLLAAAFRQR